MPKTYRNSTKLLIILSTLITLCVLFTIAYAQAGAGAELGKAIEILGRRIGAGLAFGLAAAGAGIGIGLAGAAAVGGMIERRELFAMYLLFIALAEAIAIYGFAIAFILM